MICLRLRNFCCAQPLWSLTPEATKPSYAIERRCPINYIRAVFLLQVCTATIPGPTERRVFSQFQQRPCEQTRSTAFTGKNWYDDNKLSSSRHGYHHSCSAHRPTCILYGARRRCVVSRFPGFWMPLIRTSENSLNKGSAVSTREKENKEETLRYMCGMNNHEHRARANARLNTS